MKANINRLYNIVELENLTSDEIDRLISELECLRDTKAQEEEKENMRLSNEQILDDARTLESIGIG